MAVSALAPVLESASVHSAAPALRPWRHRFACFHVVATFLLLIAGASVTSNDAGLAVVDWPTSLGFLNPLAIHLRGLMHGLVAFEHGHREIAMAVGLLTIALSTWLWITATRRAHRVLGVVLLAGLIFQGVLGGITVTWKLPAAISVMHGMVAQSFFCLSIATAYLLSAEWQQARGGGRTLPVADASLTRAARIALVAIFAQLLLGAIVRHTVAKWRVPLFTDLPVLLHAGFAIVVLGAIGRLVARTNATAGLDRRLVRPALLLGTLAGVQLVLGLLSIVTRTDPLVTVLHVVTGAAILGTSFFLVLRHARLAGAGDAATEVAPS